MDELYWVWLSMALKPGARIKSLVSFYENPYNIYDASDVDLYLCPFLKSSQVDELFDCDISGAERAVETCRNNGWTILTPDSRLYPKRLLELESYPAALYCFGDMPDLNERFSVGMVGTRYASNYAITSAYNIACDLASEDAVIVSGGALGVDSAAHKGAMARGGQTVAVLGNGLGDGYLPENEPLRRLISENGAVVSEFPPFTHPTKLTFPVRNRLISGMSEGVVVIEAGVRSGSLITAEYAIEQGRRLFALTGGENHGVKSRYAGNARLLAEGKADPISCAEDVLNAFGKSIGDQKRETAPPVGVVRRGERRHRPPTVVSTAPADAGAEEEKQPENAQPAASVTVTTMKTEPDLSKLSDRASAVYRKLKESPMDADELMDGLGADMKELMAAILELQLRKLIRNDFGQKYSIIY